MSKLFQMQDAITYGKAEFVRWKEKFEAEMFYDEGILQLKVLFDIMPQETKDKLQQSNPEGYRKVMELIEGDSNGRPST